MEAHLLARLLGMPLLRVHADVLLVPVRLRDDPPPAAPWGERARPVRAVTRPVAPARSPGDPERTGLDEARRLVLECERDLQALPPARHLNDPTP